MWRERWIYVLALPGIVYFLLFHYWPLLGNIIAFQDYSPFLGYFRSTWVGFANFARLFTDPDILIVLKNTLVISLLQLIFVFPSGIILALLLNAVVSERLKRLMQSVVYLPHFLSWVIIVSIWQQIFGGDGFINHLITGTGGQPIDFLGNPNLFQPMIILQIIWKESGWSTIIFLAALSGINLQLYEAAVVDGASKWRRLWHITLPGIRNIIALLLILRIGSVLSTGFEQIFLQQKGMPMEVAEVIDTFVYSRGILNGEWGYTAAVALTKALIGLILIYTSNKIARKFGEEGLL